MKLFSHMISHPKLLNRLTVLKHKAEAMLNQGIFALPAFPLCWSVPSVQRIVCPNSEIHNYEAPHLDTTLDRLRGGVPMPIYMRSILSTLRYGGRIENGNQLLRAFRPIQFLVEVLVEVTHGEKLIKLVPKGFPVEFSRPCNVCKGIASAKSNVKQQEVSQKFLWFGNSVDLANLNCCIDKVINLITKHLQFVLLYNFKPDDFFLPHPSINKRIVIMRLKISIDKSCHSIDL